MINLQQSTVRPIVSFEVSKALWEAYGAAKRAKDINKITELHLKIFYSPGRVGEQLENLSPELPHVRQVNLANVRVIHPVPVSPTLS